MVFLLAREMITLFLWKSTIVVHLFYLDDLLAKLIQARRLKIERNDLTNLIPPIANNKKELEVLIA